MLTLARKHFRINPYFLKKCIKNAREKSISRARLGLDVRDFEHFDMFKMRDGTRDVEDLSVRQIDGVVDDQGWVILVQVEQVGGL